MLVDDFGLMDFGGELLLLIEELVMAHRCPLMLRNFKGRFLISLQ